MRNPTIPEKPNHLRIKQQNQHSRSGHKNEGERRATKSPLQEGEARTQRRREIRGRHSILRTDVVPAAADASRSALSANTSKLVASYTSCYKPAAGAVAVPVLSSSTSSTIRHGSQLTAQAQKCRKSGRLTRPRTARSSPRSPRTVEPLERRTVALHFVAVDGVRRENESDRLELEIDWIQA